MPADVAGLGEVWPALDGARLVASAARHGVSAVVADFLAAHRLALPSAPQRQLLGDAQRAIAAGLRTRRLTLETLDALGACGVVPVLLKGAGLADRLYRDQPLARPASDVDVWVAPEELAAAGRALAQEGFFRQRDAGLVDEAQEHHHESWVAPRKLVELHFRLFSGFGRNAFDDAAVRARTVPGEFHGRPVRWLCPEDEFVYLATHTANHGFLRASWLVDLQRALLCWPTLDWAVMAARCREARFHAAVAAALWVLQGPMRVTLPPGALRAFPVSRLRAAGHARVFSAAQLESARLAEHRVGGFGLRLWLVDSPRDGLAHAVDGGRRLVRRLRSSRASSDASV